MSPRIKLAVAAHIDDSSIFFLSFFIACWACLRLDCGLLRRLLFFLYVPVIFLTLPLSVFCHLRFMLFFRFTLILFVLPSFLITGLLPFLFPVFLSSRLFALSLFFILFLPSLFLQFRHLRVIVSTCELLFKGVRVIQLQMTSLAVVPWLCIHTKAHRMQQVTASSPP